MQKAEVGKSYRTALVPELRSIDEKNRTIDFVASTEAVDRYGDVIRVAGWDFASYKKNPVFLFGHRSQDPPIGKCVKIWTEQNPAPALCQTIQFADAVTYGFADTIFNLYKNGFMRAVSVGFMPTVQPVPFSDLEGHFVGYEFNGQELLELSAVPIPANPEALARCVQKGFSQTDLARVFSGEESEAALWQQMKELVTTSLDLADRALDLANEKVQETLAELKAQAAKPRKSAELLANFVDTTVPDAIAETEITSVDQLADSEHQITSVEQLGESFLQAPNISSEEAWCARRSRPMPKSHDARRAR